MTRSDRSSSLRPNALSWSCTVRATSCRSPTRCIAGRSAPIGHSSCAIRIGGTRPHRCALRRTTRVALPRSRQRLEERCACEHTWRTVRHARRDCRGPLWRAADTRKHPELGACRQCLRDRSILVLLVLLVLFVLGDLKLVE